MKLSNLISKFHQTFARVFLAFNLFDSLFPHHATKLKQNHQLNLKNSEPTQSKNDAAQARFEVLETGVMRCVGVSDRIIPGATLVAGGTRRRVDSRWKVLSQSITNTVC
jgi:hypothetical protein